MVRNVARMKRGAPQHPKTFELAAALRVPQYAAVGILESVWHFAAQFAQAGDIGRFTDEAIARAIGWEGEPGALIRALESAHWVERCECHGLRIHDWPDHADQTVQRILLKRGQGFLACYDDASFGLAKTSQPLPLPLPKAVSLKAGSLQPAANPLIEPGGRPKLELELLRLVRREAELTNRDGAEVMAEVSHYEGAKLSKLNPSTMSDDRLLNTLLDARSRVARLEKKYGGKAGGSEGSGGPEGIPGDRGASRRATDR